MSTGPRAIDLGLAGCPTCGLLVRLPARRRGACPRCGTTIRVRKRDSISTTWALIVAAVLMYFPANLLPIMTTVYLGAQQSDTIVSGVIFLTQQGSWPLALIVFVASVLVPLLKIVALTYLLFSVQRRSAVQRHQRARLYRVTELVGRWSMVDVFVVALLAALVQMQALVSIQPGGGAVAFAAVVILTMLAAMSFDPRLIWDHEESGDECGA